MAHIVDQLLWAEGPKGTAQSKDELASPPEVCDGYFDDHLGVAVDQHAWVSVEHPLCVRADGQPDAPWCGLGVEDRLAQRWRRTRCRSGCPGPRPTRSGRVGRAEDRRRAGTRPRDRCARRRRAAESDRLRGWSPRRAPARSSAAQVGVLARRAALRASCAQVGTLDGDRHLPMSISGVASSPLQLGDDPVESVGSGGRRHVHQGPEPGKQGDRLVGGQPQRAGRSCRRS